jgi:hypothetical protein
MTLSIPKPTCHCSEILLEGYEPRCLQNLWIFWSKVDAILDVDHVGDEMWYLCSGCGHAKSIQIVKAWSNSHWQKPCMLTTSIMFFQVLHFLLLPFCRVRLQTPVVKSPCVNNCIICWKVMISKWGRLFCPYVGRIVIVIYTMGMYLEDESWLDSNFSWSVRNMPTEYEIYWPGSFPAATWFHVWVGLSSSTCTGSLGELVALVSKHPKSKCLIFLHATNLTSLTCQWTRVHSQSEWWFEIWS